MTVKGEISSKNNWEARKYIAEENNFLQIKQK